MQTQRYRLGYRGDIEGLRAVAILLVVAAHAKVHWLAGGFVGVDVFYVLSGYLITGLLVQEIQTTRNLRFADFYARRLRRLLPALMLMLAVTCVLGWLLLAPGEQPGQAKAGVGAALWLSNFYFAFSQMGYFAPGTETNLFLHTWSLGVEEQFYLVWPLLLVLVMGAWQGAKNPPSARRLKWGMVGIFVLSLALSLYWTRNAPHLAFYMMPSRAWQFALGGLTFLRFGAPAYQPDARARRGTWLIAASWIGLGLIVLAAWLLDEHVAYPGTWALLPSFGAALVLAAGSHGSMAGAGRLLSLRPMQAIGRVSYAWYLWHWPALLLGAALLDFSNGWNRAALAVLSLLIAFLSYHFFETPIRRNRKLIARPRMAVFVALALMIVAGSFALRWRNAAVQRMDSPEQLPYELVRTDAPIIYGMDCDEWYHSADVHICAFGDKSAAHTAVALGDSVALQWFPVYAQVFDKPGWRLLVVTKSSCPMVAVPIFYPRIGREYTECAQWRHDGLLEIASLKPDVVIFGSTFTYDYTQTQWIEGTRQVLRSLSANAKQVYVMRSTPTLPFDGPSCLAPRSWLYRALSSRARCTGPAHTVLADNVYQWLGAASTPFANVHLVDMTNSVCPGGLCRAQINGKIVFRDDQHMSATFAQSLGPALENALNLQKLGVAYADSPSTRKPASGRQAQERP